MHAENGAWHLHAAQVAAQGDLLGAQRPQHHAEGEDVCLHGTRAPLQDLFIHMKGEVHRPRWYQGTASRVGLSACFSRP